MQNRNVNEFSIQQRYDLREANISVAKLVHRLAPLANVLWVVAPKSLGGLAIILLNISLLKWFAPEIYGVYSLALTAMVLLSEGLFGSAIDLAVLRSASLYSQQGLTDKASQMERCGLISKLTIMSLISLLLCPLVLSAPHISFLTSDTRALLQLAPLIGVGSILMLALGSALLSLQLRQQFFRYGLLDLCHITIKYGGISAMLIAFSLHSRALVPSHVLVWFGIGPAMALAAYSLQIRLKKRPFLPVVPEIRLELWQQAKWIFLTQLISSVANKLDMMTMASLTDMKQVGIFMGGQTIASIPILAGSYLAIVLNPQVMPRFRSGSLFRFLRDTQIVLFLAAVVAYGLIVANYGWMEELILPKSFKGSSEVIMILLPMMLVAMTSYPVVLACLLFLSPRSLIKMECILLPITLIAYVALVPSHGAWGAAVVTSVVGIIKTIVAQWIAFRLAVRSSNFSLNND